MTTPTQPRAPHQAIAGGAYVATALLTMTLLLATAAGFCTLVDPYGIFGMPRISHVTAVKSAAAARLRLSKAYRVEAAHPATLVTGSSVTNLGIDPDSPAWRPEHRPVFNLGLDGATLAEQRRYLLNALAVSHPSLVVLCTSFEDLMPQPPGAGFADGAGPPELRRLDDGRPNPNFPLAHLKDVVSATLSFRALSDSALTLVRQSGAWVNYQTEAGFEIHAPEEMYAATQGTGAAFAKMNRTMAQRMIAWTAHPTWSLEPLAVMIEAARAAGADVVVLVPPIHADLVEIQRQLGLAGAAEDWRAALSRLVDAEAAAHGGPERVRMWDFGGLSGYTIADWFWDTAHFNPDLGTLMIRRVETDGDPRDLGIRLDAKDVADSAAAFDAAERDWVDAHPGDVERLAALLAATRRDICRTTETGCDTATKTAVLTQDAVFP